MAGGFGRPGNAGLCNLQYTAGANTPHWSYNRLSKAGAAITLFGDSHGDICDHWLPVLEAYSHQTAMDTAAGYAGGGCGGIFWKPGFVYMGIANSRRKLQRFDRVWGQAASEPSTRHTRTICIHKTSHVPGGNPGGMGRLADVSNLDDAGYRGDDVRADLQGTQGGASPEDGIWG